MCRQHGFFLVHFQILWPPLLTWNFHIIPGNFFHIPGTSDTWKCFSSVLYRLAYSHIVLISRYFPNSSSLYFIGAPPPIPSLVSPILLRSSFLGWSSLWNAYCFVISFCSLLFVCFVCSVTCKLCSYCTILHNIQFHSFYLYFDIFRMAINYLLFKICCKSITVKLYLLFIIGAHFCK